MPESKVVALHVKPPDGGVVPQKYLRAIAGKGFVGDKCGGRRRRQVLLISTHNLDEFNYKPGTLREQITTDMEGLQNLAPGTKLLVGSVVIEVTQDCEPCTKMANYLDEDPDGFKSKTAGKRGMLGKILTDGEIKLGDSIQVTSG